MIENHWQLQDAKNKFSNLVEIVQKKGPQIVTKHGKEAVVVISINEYNRLIKPKTTLVEFFKNSPLAKEGVECSRNKEMPRDISL
ncbi:prevent-host-death family protein [Desulfocicer vacuolatum DSM 3385]|uniref:Antitoxin n=1 Tax=Desulfocicer vacuolatum DSM 3385 TaxID=1121400 RepID=A0A1W2EZT8_9BACT|nr:type II toxin-antitoxin system Phd/YefM family antitoxin [Desulfocicer vacuolatum]SMD14738.1 prevent-host-death family protein [Desulfocicer vacuolatum DSM 3385]